MSVGQNIFEKNKLYHGDCLEVMKQIPDNYIDHIICDLPFYQVVKDDWDNQWKDENDYINWCRNVIVEYKRIIKENGNLFVFTGRQAIFLTNPFLKNLVQMSKAIKSDTAFSSFYENFNGS